MRRSCTPSRLSVIVNLCKKARRDDGTYITTTPRPSSLEVLPPVFRFHKAPPRREGESEIAAVNQGQHACKKKKESKTDQHVSEKLDGNTNLTSPLASGPLPAPTAEASLDPSLFLVQGPLSPHFKCCLPHPLRIAAAPDDDEPSAVRGGGIGPLYRSFSHNSTSRISEFQHSSVSLSSSMICWMIVEMGVHRVGRAPSSIPAEA
jgi:hypothetical protein